MNQRLLVMRARKLPVIYNASQNEIDVLNYFLLSVEIIISKSRCLRVEIALQFVAQFLTSWVDPRDKGTHAQ